MGKIYLPPENLTMPNQFINATIKGSSLKSDIQLHAVLLAVREAVKIPVMWRLRSHEDVNKLRRQHVSLKHFPARNTWMI